ncbi:hypothetical protein [Streptomyces poonensis]|uniref:Secreted protein n=1 Tax=Streptomyces poonensis TaxID=68255 RepID=A0A918PVA9_9ACTN|nr:hypothetical protein [Streptomyces poonensis]GGZ24563.1 hypothetical protein GCM10010365_51110 [Streptomyces poonensis]GLJ89997.1 hypothetical protein GCM10017589_25980 [Streptomyces poonensis]
MSPAPHAPRTVRRCVWPRVLLLLLALLLPAAHAGAATAPAVAVTTETADQDALESTARFPARQVCRAHRPTAARRPVPPAPPAHPRRQDAERAPLLLPPPAPYALLIRRSVVLRC